jgi:glycerol-3-phosphate dehydrogenase
MPDLLAEAAYAARHEQAATVGDVLLRRTRLALTAARDVTAGDAPRRVAGVLGLDTERAAAEFREEAASEGVVV